jgi:undecaprenyl-diphosphatase
MRSCLRVFLPVLLLLATAFVRADIILPRPIQQEEPVGPLTARAAVALGAVEGVTEFLPVSSTGHLIVVSSALGLDREEPLHDAKGQPLWLKPPSGKRPAGVALTLKNAADAFTVIIQFGAIAAVVLLYWRQLLAMLNGLLGRDAAGRRLLTNVLLAFVPAAVVGLLAHSFIEEKLFSISAVIAAQVVGALFMWWAERRAAKNAKRQTPNAKLSAEASDDSALRTPHSAIEPTASSLTPAQSLGIGALQCLALWPGTSRSMTAIVGARLVGLGPRAAAEFSFLLGLVTLTAATAYKSWSSGAGMVAAFGWPHILLGCAVATVTAALSVKFLVNWLVKHGLMLFVWYRLALAVVLTALLAKGIL